MPKPRNAMTIFQLLDKSNCKQCGEKACMAFAGAVFTGRRPLSECPKLDQDIIDAYSDDFQNLYDVEQNRDDFLEQLKKQIAGIDLKVVAPFLNYVLYGKGLDSTGDWRSFRELADGRERYPLFQKRCEEQMKQVDPRFQSDISVVLHPLPKVPIMVCYWLPEEGMQSSLNVFFDQTADKNLDIGSIYSLGNGLAQMFTRLARRHGLAMAS